MGRTKGIALLAAALLALGAPAISPAGAVPAQAQVTMKVIDKLISPYQTMKMHVDLVDAQGAFLNNQMVKVHITGLCLDTVFHVVTHDEGFADFAIYQTQTLCPGEYTATAAFESSTSADTGRVFTSIQPIF